MYKLIPGLLLFCLITLTYQQYPPGDYWPAALRNFHQPPHRHRQQLVDSLSPHYDLLEDEAEYDEKPAFRNLQSSLMRAKDTETRGLISNLIASSPDRVNGPQGKWLLPNLLSNLFMAQSQQQQQLAISTSTVTTLSTITSTLTVVSVQSCIASGQFETVSSTAKTMICARRKRTLDVLLEEVPEAISPSKVFSMVTTEAPEVKADTQLEVESSKVLDMAESAATSLPHHVRKNRAFVWTTTSTITVTTFSLQTTPLKKSFTLVGAASLQCLPPGFSVC